MIFILINKYEYYIEKFVPFIILERSYSQWEHLINGIIIKTIFINFINFRKYIHIISLISID